MNIRIATRVPLAALTLLLAACGGPASEPPAGAAADTAAVAAADTDTDTDADTGCAIPAGGNPDPEQPRLAVTTLDGDCWRIEDQRGQWLVVNFWATWCKPCLKEIPDLDAFDAAREDVTVIGLAYEEIDPEEMKAFLAALPSGAPRYAIAPLDVYAPPADFETPRGLPLTFLIDPEGRVAKKFLGPVTSQELAETIAASSGMAAGE
ncbi:MAG TPA: TlpA disulfide reductase family protein [Arenimonas sp.]|nr:TlpA disulfide reductase family protein [Arenimonas sp.]